MGAEHFSVIFLVKIDSEDMSSHVIRGFRLKTRKRVWAHNCLQLSHER